MVRVGVGAAVPEVGVEGLLMFKAEREGGAGEEPRWMFVDALAKGLEVPSLLVGVRGLGGRLKAFGLSRMGLMGLRTGEVGVRVKVGPR